MFWNWLELEERPIRSQVLLRCIRPRQNKGMKILVLSKNFSASSCNIFSTFQMFKTDIWFLGFFREFQLNYFWKKMFSRYGCLKFYLTILKFLAKWMVVNIIFCFQLGHVSSFLLARPISEALFTLRRLSSLKTEVSLWKRIRDTTITSHFGVVYERNSGREITLPSCAHRPSKIGVSKFLRFEECLRKAPFSWRISEF